VLSDRLRKLVEAGVLSAVPYREPGRRARKEYRLTAKGLDLFPVLVSLLDWGDRYCADAVGPSVRLDHRECGAALQAVVQCDSGHVIESPRESVVSPGPGAQRL
jgi:hypothetical protein